MSTEDLLVAKSIAHEKEKYYQFYTGKLTISWVIGKIIDDDGLVILSLANILVLCNPSKMEQLRRTSTYYEYVTYTV